MTLKEAVLLSLNDINEITNYLAVHNKIIEKKYYDFGQARTPGGTISAILGDFIRKGDTRVKRIKQENGTYWYYLTRNEESIGIEVLSGTTSISSSETNNAVASTPPDNTLPELGATVLCARAKRVIESSNITTS